MKTNRVFLDTNILMNDFLHRFPQFARLPDDVNRLHCANAIQHVRRNRLFKTYIASFSIARLVSLLESLRVPKNIVVQEIERLLAKNNVVNLTASLISNATDLFKNDPLLTDFEDAFQYAVCRNNDCYYLLTLNIKDFRHFQSIVVVHPVKYRIMVV
jgi:predicted nucleic acid-binding protein